ncbi:unnamed protein product [Brachionus calyciflorus]|uniref:Uncharacterized protein n=1 Tax=Brachionus calyciflorus TaxID=104777 RepID=A0A814DKG1_9BILA|nr:unnamed protein product [Brachionus calyciflorus]
MDYIDNLRSEITKIQENENESLKIELIESVKHIEELNIIFQNEIKNIREDYENRKTCDEFNHNNEKEKLAKEFSEKIEILKNDYRLKNSLEFKRIKDEKDLVFSKKVKKMEQNFNAKNQQLASANSEITKKQNELRDKEREINSLKDQHKKDLEEFDSTKPTVSFNDDIQIISNKESKCPGKKCDGSGHVDPKYKRHNIFENCPKNPRNAHFINLISQLTSANEKLQLEIKNLNISLENEELISREYRIDELENEVYKLTEKIQDLQETLEKSILPSSGEKNVGPIKVGKYDSKGARRGRDVYMGTSGGYFL